MDEDYALALQLQSEYFMENESSIFSNDVGSKKEPKSLVDPYWEMTDPNPDIRALFLQFNDRFFWGRLSGIEVKWSPRMTLCAGLCCYEGRGGLCSVRLSVPLLKLRPRKDLVETLLHEMIHAYLFVTDNNKDHDGHGPEFHKHMYRINHEAGTKITVYHNFHDEVNSYRQHWWRCDGPCRSRKPYFGYVKRSMNRAPSKNDTWWAEHQRTCGGTYTKVKEPEDYGKKKSKKGGDKEKQEKEKSKVKSMDIRIFGGEGKTLGGSKPIGQPSPGSSKSFGKSSDTTALPSTSTVSTAIDTNTSSQQTSSKNTCDFPSLPGGRTPDKKVVPRNKPVSQGGGAKFKDKKVKKVIDFDWTDSEDEEILANISRSQSNDLTNQKRDIPDFSDDSDLEVVSESDLMNSQHSNRKERTGSSNTDVTFRGQSCDIENEHTVEDVHDDIVTASVDKDGTTKHEASDVQAMLRKVWGEKKFNTNTGKRKLGQGHLKSFVISGNTGGQVKRPSGEAGLTEIEHSKKPKLINEKSLQSWTETSVDEVKHEQKNICGKHESPRKQPKQANSVTSPIEKLFNKMREKQSTLRDSQTVSASSGSVKTVNQTADTSTSDNTLMNKKQDGENSSRCPVCGKQVPTSTINDHLDLCLTLQEIS